MHVIAVNECQTKYKSYSMYKSMKDFINNINETKQDEKTNEGIKNDYKDNTQIIDEIIVKNINNLRFKYYQQFCVYLLCFLCLQFVYM